MGGEAKALAGQTCFRINRLLPVPYPADVKCPLRDGFLHRTRLISSMTSRRASSRVGSPAFTLYVRIALIRP